ncbi:hypothetical protein [Acetanaerobacterium elongatum]|uniref:Uncharacterized protein n=1 Tax=Acetanaerobacterium elongatum TaxID=258515 RepID=A0A1G9Z0V8_9FIRM|nr:hypothetical protein [Acetanaerobacterium elongatum]SDN14373.1 hypothetical protein SAMN05192585_11234 [Acetanaerobacterium elongatum]
MEYTHADLHKAYAFLFDFILGKISINLHNGVPADQVRLWVMRTIGKLEPRPEKQAFMDFCLGWVNVVVSVLPETDPPPEQMKLE